MFSIVVPCYNCENSLEQCYKSLVSQSEPNYEVILVDDGSTDQTSIMCDGFGQTEAKVKVIHQENGGLMNAWKSGVRQAEGEYIVFVDSDDWIENDLLANLTNVADAYNPDVITYGFRTEYGDEHTVDKTYPLDWPYYKSKEEIEKYILPFFFTSGKMESQKVIYSRWSKTIKKELLLSIMEQLDETISIGEDTLTSFLIFLNAKSVYNLKDAYFYHYIRTENSMMGNYGAELVKKLVDTRNCLVKTARKYSYPHIGTVENYLLDNVLITAKKVLWNKALSWKEKKETIDKIMEIDEVHACMEKSKVYAHTYSLKHKLFIGCIKIGRCH